MRVSAVILTIAAAVAAQSTYTATGVGCEPHDDHWHCPAGVAEPTTAPAQSAEASVDTVSATASGVCEPHDDHWHCPSGVAEPTYAPSAAPVTTSAASAASGSITSAPSASASHSHDDEDDHSHAVTATTCEPHNDHWHCPSGVAEPTTAPAQTSATSSRASTASGAGASGSTSTTPPPSTGAGSAVGASQQGIVAVVLGAVGAFFL